MRKLNWFVPLAPRWTPFAFALAIAMTIDSPAALFAAPKNDDGVERIQRLVEDLGGGDTGRAVAAAKELAELGTKAETAIDGLIRAAASESAELRAAAVNAIGAIGPAAHAALPALIARFEDTDVVGNDEVWVLASQAAGRMGDAAVDPLIGQLDPQNARRYVAACGALHDLGPMSRKAMSQLREQIVKDDNLTIPAMFVVAGMGPEGREALDDIIKILDSKNFHHQYWACRAIGEMRDAGGPAVPKLMERLKDGVVSVRRHAAAALGNIGPSAGPEAIGALIAAIDDRLEPVREDAVIALGKMGSSAVSAAPKLKEALAGTRMTARGRLAGALSKVDPNEEAYAFEVLLIEIQSPNAPWSAADELAKLAPKLQRVDEVAKLLDSDNDETQQFTCDALAAMGSAAREHLAALKRLEADEDEEPDVRSAARSAIAAISAVIGNPNSK